MAATPIEEKKQNPPIKSKVVKNELNDKKISELKRDYRNWNKKTKITRNLYYSQCPGLVNNFPEKSLIDAVTLGRDNNIPLIMYIADTFSRYRINQFYNNNKYKKDISISDFKNNLPFYRSMEESQNKGTAIHAVLSSYHSRFVPKLEFEPNIKFNDNIEDIAKYIYAVSQMIESVLKEREQNKNISTLSSDDQEDIIPFQFDLVIIPKHNNINQEYEKVITVDTDDSDDDDSDNDDESEESYENGQNYKKIIDDIGFIEPRLRKHNIKHNTFQIDKKLLKSNASAQIKRKLNEKFKEIRKGRNGRYVMIVDRRNKDDIQNIIDINHDDDDDDDDNDDIKKKEMDKEALKIKPNDGKQTDDDKIYIYSPKCEQDKKLNDNDDDDDDEKGSNDNYDKLHTNFIEESLLFKTKKCLIPGFNEDIIDKHLGADCRNMITLSFHVLSMDLIKCYLYLNGTGSRFQPIDLIKLLPLYFEKAPPKNSHILSESNLSSLFPLKLKDEKFDIWYKTTTRKKKKI